MMKRFTECKRGMGIGGWLTNYKRFNVLPEHRKMDLINFLKSFSADFHL